MMRDFRAALRSLRKRPGLASVAILSLALGIGANATIFSFANALMFRQPPVAQPNRLVEVYIHDPTPGAALSGQYPLSYLDYLDFSQRTHSLSGLAIYNPGTEVSALTGGEGSTGAAWNGELVSPNYFDVLGIRPALGRWFTTAEGTVAGSSPVMVLSYTTWQKSFGGSRTALGRQIPLNGMPFTVIGVAPEGFDGLFSGFDAGFWAPVTMAARLGSPGMLDRRGSHGLFAVGRLRPGVTVGAASAEMNVIEREIARAHPHDVDPSWSAEAVPLGPVPAPFRGFVGVGAGLLMAVVGLVLLIACANAALVMLVEALGRRREWAVRAALGASRGRLIRLGLVHSILLALIAGGLGLLLAQWLGPMLLRLRPPGFPVALHLGADSHVVLFTVAVALLTGVLFGLAPAWQGARVRVLDNLKDGTPGAGSARSWTRSAFIVAQVALCLVVLVGAGLCLRSLQHANAINPGFEPQHLLLTAIDPASLGYKDEAARQFMQRVQQQVEAMPGVEAAGWNVQPPLQVSESDTSILPVGMAPPANRQGFQVDTTTVGPDYFRAAGTTLVAGRGFGEGDVAAGKPPVVVMNETLARQFWPGGDAVGRGVRVDGKIATIVGVAANGKYRSLGEKPRGYLFQLQAINTPATLLVRVAGEPRAFRPGLERQLAGLDPNLTSDSIQTGAEFMQVPLFPARFTGILLGGFGVLALLLAVAGLYGVIAASVAQRTREYGIRMALGANGPTLLRMVLGQGLRLTAWGIAIGAVLALALTQAMGALLYGMSALDPLSYAAAAAILAGVALAASYVPARRAMRVDPLRALRWE